MDVGMLWVVMCSSQWTNHRVMVSYLVNGWIILKLVSVLLLTQGSVILLTLHYGRLQNLVNQVGRALGVMEDQDGTSSAVP
jgi:hypothetical protein